MKIYVGKLPYSADDRELVELFSQYGEVSSASIVKDTYSIPNRSKGFGFVEMPNPEEADKAIAELNNFQVGRMSLVVSAKKRRELTPPPVATRDDTPTSDDIPTYTDCVLGPDGEQLEPDSEAHKLITADFLYFSEKLLDELKTNQGLWHTMSHRTFEEVIAELLNRQGYDVTLTRPSKDGGKDIYAAQRTQLGSFLYI